MNQHSLDFIAAATAGHGLVVAGWLVMAGAVFGWGALAARLLGTARMANREPFLTFWLGYSVLLCVLSAWHLVLPVDGKASVLFVVGLIFCARWGFRRPPFRAARRLKPGRGAAVSAVVAILVLAVSNFAIGPVLNYDTGLYHLNAVRWIETYPAVPGIGNLHSRLAYNSSSLLLPAAFDHGWFEGRSRHIVNGLLILVLLLQAAAAAARCWVARHRPAQLVRAVYWGMLAGPAWHLAAAEASSLSTDVPAYVLQFVLMGTLLDMLLSGGPFPRRPARRVGPAIVLGCAVVTVKLSALVLAAGLVLVAVATCKSSRSSPVPRSALGWAIALGLLGVCSWAARGYIISGYPAFPVSTALGLPADWRVPAETVLEERDWMVAFARRHGARPEEVLGRWDWVPGWWGRALGDRWHFRTPITLLALGSVAHLAATLGPRRDRLHGSARTLVLGGWVWITVAVALAFWWLGAPSPRYGYGTLHVAGAWAVCSGIGRLLDRGRPRAGVAVALAALVLSCWWVTAIHPFPNPPGSSNGLHPLPEVVFTERVTDSGLKVLVLATYPEDDRVWDGPLPSTPYFSRALEARRPGRLERGFRVAAGP